MGSYYNSFFVAISKIYLVLLNIVLLISGIVAFCRGLYLRRVAEELSKNIIYHVLGVDDIYRQISVKFLVPGFILTIFGYFGCFGAGKMKRSLLSCYIFCLLILVGLNIYNMRENNTMKISLFSYLRNNVFTSEIDVLDLQDGNPTPELIMQVLALVTSFYLYYAIGKRAEMKALLALHAADLSRVNLIVSS